MTPKIIQLTEHIQRANAALTALQGGMRHDGRRMADPEEVLRVAFMETTRAYSIVVECVRQKQTTGNPLIIQR